MFSLILMLKHDCPGLVGFSYSRYSISHLKTCLSYYSVSGRGKEIVCWPSAMYLVQMAPVA